MIKIIYYSRKIPEKVDDQLTLASSLIEKRREIAEVDQALAAQKEVKFVIYMLPIV